MELKHLEYNLRYTPRFKNKIDLEVLYHYYSSNVELTEEQLIKFIQNPFTHFHIINVDTGLSKVVFDNLVCFSKMTIIEFLNTRIRWIDFMQLQLSAAYVYDKNLERIKFEYIRTIKQIMKLPSELKYLNSSLGVYFHTAHKNNREMTPTQITLFRNASLTFTKIRELFNKHNLDFSKYTIAVMSNYGAEDNIAGIWFPMNIDASGMLAVLPDDNYDNIAIPKSPDIKEVIFREENVKVKGKDEKRERIYVKYK